MAKGLSVAKEPKIKIMSVRLRLEADIDLALDVGFCCGQDNSEASTFAIQFLRNPDWPLETGKHCKPRLRHQWSVKRCGIAVRPEEKPVPDPLERQSWEGSGGRTLGVPSFQNILGNMDCKWLEWGEKSVGDWVLQLDGDGLEYGFIGGAIGLLQAPFIDEVFGDFR